MRGTEHDVATAVVRRLRDSGHEAYFVGGCVREMMLGAQPKDYDVTTDALPDRVAELFPKVVEVGKRFGVVMVVESGTVVEVATYRTEGSYSDGRRPDSVRFATAREDVSRRDFTVNALLLDPLTGELIDHVGGLADLRAGLLRTVGDPHERFREDHLRLLRAVRFTARLGFRLDDAARRACVELAPLSARVSAERLHDELTRMLSHRSRAAAMRLLEDLGLRAHVLPEIDAITPEALVTLERLRADAGAEPAWSVVLEGDAARAEGLARRLRMSRKETERVLALVRGRGLPAAAPAMRQGALRRLLASPALDDLLDVARAGSHDDAAGAVFLEEARARWGTRLPPPLVDGSDLAQAGVAPGPAMGRVLEALRDEQLDGSLTTRAQALVRAEQLVKG